MLRVEGLTQRVGERLLFEALSFEVEAGRTVVVQGPSGSGKTRLLRAIALLDPLHRGAVFLEGRPPERWGIPAWRAEVAYVPQDPPDLPSTAEAWWASVGRYRSRRGREVRDPVALAEGWGVPPARWVAPWSRLSGGERQRILLAMAVARRPRVLLLDEPTSSLDPAAVSAVEASLAGTTALWVTHDPAQARRVAVETIEVGR